MATKDYSYATTDPAKLGVLQNRTDSGFVINVSYQETDTNVSRNVVEEKPDVLRLVNLIGLVMFLVAVIGPVAYVTFCCKHPINGDSCRCWWYCARMMAYCWCERRHLSSNDIQFDEETVRGRRRVSTSSSDDPPSYLAALSMPRLEDRIPGTPPPIYSHIIKVRLKYSESSLPTDSLYVDNSSVPPLTSDGTSYSPRNTTNSNGMACFCFTDLSVAHRSLDCSVERLGTGHGDSTGCPCIRSSRREMVELDSAPARLNDTLLTDILPSYDEGLLLLKARRETNLSER